MMNLPLLQIFPLATSGRERWILSVNAMHLMEPDSEDTKQESLTEKTSFFALEKEIMKLRQKTGKDQWTKTDTNCYRC